MVSLKENLINQDPEYSRLLLLLQEDPFDLQALFDLSQKQMEFKMHKEAMDSLLKIVKKNRSWQERKAVDELVRIFVELGNSDPNVAEARRVFQRIMY